MFQLIGGEGTIVTSSLWANSSTLTPAAKPSFFFGCKPGQTRGEPKQSAASNDPTNPRKPRYVKARERVAAWVWDLGVNDPELSPNHAWRHTFKAVGFRCGIPEKVLDAIVGHAAASVGRGYGEPTLADKRAASDHAARVEFIGWSKTLCYVTGGAAWASTEYNGHMTRIIGADAPPLNRRRL